MASKTTLCVWQIVLRNTILLRWTVVAGKITIRTDGWLQEKVTQCVMRQSNFRRLHLGRIKWEGHIMDGKQEMWQQVQV